MNKFQGLPIDELGVVLDEYGGKVRGYVYNMNTDANLTEIVVAETVAGVFRKLAIACEEFD
jgi:hypothetical protein